ncbi:hypothetical protein M0R45_014213 [Rubus argutus]|uniref:25S rRNA (uridine-N(3))-methyltransferase BMT5-like domain-containing protein n=1 Tax=Rubus argutus TaxID=59490 RepID=A0AAW1XMD8_RUBAR
MERRYMHYSSSQKILLVGEGDFSFATCLGKEFGSAANMVATSLDSEATLKAKYSDDVLFNLSDLKRRGCILLHEVDVHTMRYHPGLINKLFDRIVFNFPHAGFSDSEFSHSQIELHKNLVKGYFRSAHQMLSNCGEIHVTHKTTWPFNEWNIVELAENVGLFLVEEAFFSILFYPGYQNKRGDGNRSHFNFRVGNSSTFKFAKKLN